MNWLDIVIILTLIAGFVSGLTQGLIRSVFTLAGVILGVFLAGRYYGSVGAWFGFIHSQDVKNAVGFAIVFILIVLIFAFIAQLLRHAVAAITLGWLDRLGGAVLGVLISGIIWGALLTLWLNFFSGGAGAVKDSAVARFLVDTFPLVLSLLPGSFQGVKDFFKH